MTQGSYNTGRKYTAQGQRIAWQHDAEKGKVIFADFDRMIYGEFDWPAAIADIAPTDREIQSAYDRNAYRMSCEAMQLRSDDFAFPVRYF